MPAVGPTCTAKTRDEVWSNDHFCTLTPGHTEDHDCFCGYTWPTSTPTAT